MGKYMLLPESKIHKISSKIKEIWKGKKSKELRKIFNVTFKFQISVCTNDFSKIYVLMSTVGPNTMIAW